MQRSYDVVIVGGGVIGSSIAYFLASNPDFSGSVLVVEKDPGYHYAATTLSAASIRQQFSTAINVQISQYGIEFLRAAPQLLAVDETPVDLALREQGYLFLATAAGLQILQANHQLQTDLGAEIACLDAEALQVRFPWLNTSGLSAGSLGLRGEGWFDAYTLLQSLRKKARSLGVEYLQDEVLALEAQGSRLTHVRTREQGLIAAGQVVNAAGIHAADLLAPLGIDLPVSPRKRCVFVFDCRTRLTAMPLLVDPSGVYCRPEGDRFICGISPPAERDPDCRDYEVDYTLFEDLIWPLLAERVPAFAEIKLQHAWAGHYDFNRFDQNALLGVCGEFEQLLLANGFSGHGLQQAPAVGRGLSELIIYGAYRSLDLTPLAWARVQQGRALIEKNVV